MQAKARLALYHVSHRISKCMTPYTISEDIVLPVVVDIIVSILFGKYMAQQLKIVLLSNDIVQWQIWDIYKNLNEFQDNQYVQVRKATNIHKRILFNCLHSC